MVEGDPRRQRSGVDPAPTRTTTRAVPAAAACDAELSGLCFSLSFFLCDPAAPWLSLLQRDKDEAVVIPERKIIRRKKGK
jgi:hypothetical protein